MRRKWIEKIPDLAALIADCEAKREQEKVRKNNDAVISTSSSVASLFFAALLPDCHEERVFVLPLDATGKVLAKPILVSVGHEDGTATIDAGAIFREALKAGAEEIIVAHNHPSGDPTPSKADLAATAELKELAARLDVVFLDHIILGAEGRGGFVSLAESCDWE